MEQLILSHQQIQQKITRLAHEILENSFEEKQIFLAGISGNGIILAEKFKAIIQEESDLPIEVFQITVNKDKPWDEPITLSIDKEKLMKGYIILIDDVLNSGKTMQYALVKLLEQPTKAIKTVALVDRTHRRYPIKADYVGMSLTTTLKERVEITLDDKNSQAYLV